jgi:hypothetical protein
VLAVGEVHANLITADNHALTWTKSKSSAVSQMLSHLGDMFNSHPGPGGIVGSKVELKRWLTQAGPFSTANGRTLSLGQTKDRVVFGPSDEDSEYTYAVAECSQENASLGGVFISCQTCPQTGSQRCLHYIQ